MKCNFFKSVRVWILIGCMIVGICGTGIFMRFEAAAATLPDLLRLHVVANSDSPYDQEVKLLVRDGVFKELEALVGEAGSKEEAQALISANLERLEEVAAEILSQYADYPLTAVLEKTVFPTKSYGELVLPAGEYDALRLVLGAGEGKNWWCVIFPPLCFVDAAGNISGIPKTTQASTGRGVIKVKWKIVDFLRNGE